MFASFPCGLGPSFPRLFVRHLPETETKLNCPCVKDICEPWVSSIGRGNGVLETARGSLPRKPSVQSSGVLNPFSSVQPLSHVQLFATPWTAAHQASLSITNSQSLLKLMFIELVMPFNHLILCHPLLLPSIFPSISVFSDESVLHIM